MYCSTPLFQKNDHSKTVRICRDDEGAIIHDDISSLDDSQASEFDDDEVEKAVNDDPFVSFIHFLTAFSHLPRLNTDYVTVDDA